MIKRYEDTEEGVRALIKDGFSINIDNIKKCEPDPWIKGIWMIHFDKLECGYATKGIVHMKGYDNPYDENDVELFE